MKKTPREKLLEKWTLETYIEHLETKREKNGLLSHKQVIQAQILFAQQMGVCEMCGSRENLTADHIVPVVFLKMLGYPADRMFRIHWYQCLCRNCNISKHHKMEWDNPKTYLILEEAMQERPTWEYATLQKESAHARRQAEERCSKVMQEPLKR